MKLSKRAARRISSLINSIECAEIMRASAERKHDWQSQHYQLVQRARCVQALADEFGIIQPTLASDLKLIARDEQTPKVG